MLIKGLLRFYRNHAPNFSNLPSLKATYFINESAREYLYMK